MTEEKKPNEKLFYTCFLLVKKQKKKWENKLSFAFQVLSKFVLALNKQTVNLFNSILITGKYLVKWVALTK